MRVGRRPGEPDARPAGRALRAGRPDPRGRHDPGLRHAPGRRSSTGGTTTRPSPSPSPSTTPTPTSTSVAALRDLGRPESLRYVNPGVQAVQWHMPFLLTEEANDPGITQIYNDLMSSGGHGNTYSTRVPAGFPHATFGDCQTWFGRTHGATVLAVRDSDGLVVSPWDQPVPQGRRCTTWPSGSTRAADRDGDPGSSSPRNAARPTAAADDQEQPTATVVSTGTTTQRRLNLGGAAAGRRSAAAGRRRPTRPRPDGAPGLLAAAGRPGGRGRRGPPSRARPSRPTPACGGPRRRSAPRTPRHRRGRARRRGGGRRRRRGRRRAGGGGGGGAAGAAAARACEAGAALGRVLVEQAAQDRLERPGAQHRRRVLGDDRHQRGHRLAACRTAAVPRRPRRASRRATTGRPAGRGSSPLARSGAM